MDPIPSSTPATPNKPEARIRVRRHPERARYDSAALHAVLRDGWLAHVGMLGAEGEPVVIPMLYAMIGANPDSDPLSHQLYLHGAVASRLLVQLSTGLPCCICVTHLDGLVLARSHFAHSVNYRSAVLFGRTHEVTDGAEKARALSEFVDKLLPGRAAEARPADASELGATRLLRFEIEAASVKIRAGAVKDHADDLQLPVWAGVLPMRYRYEHPQPEADAPTQLPDSVRRLLDQQGD
jgi:nitroimidazol reductase NimA-like FMN-containing flavoprotein (pyridoxamine 5'-phosphate oxidase superfamily)